MRFDSSVPVWIAAALILVVLMALPLGWLAWLSVEAEGGATLAHYRAVFVDSALQKALWNTLVLAFWVGLASLAVGAPLAWLTARTDVPGRGADPRSGRPQALALFGSPAILAMPAGFHTITTQIWSFFHFPPKTEMV